LQQTINKNIFTGDRSPFWFFVNSVKYRDRGGSCGQFFPGPEVGAPAPLSKNFKQSDKKSHPNATIRKVAIQ